MASNPASGRPGLAQRFRQEYPADEWVLLTRLPRAVLIAATASAAAGPAGHSGPGPGSGAASPGRRRTVAEGLAGLEALAAGRFSDSDLVRAVVSAIYAETDERPAVGPVLGDCRRAAVALAARADPADSAAYRQWVQHVAARVCAGSERDFLVDLGVALGLR
jgi:hypothetical protein